MAALTAAALSAEMCFCFSGQISLEGCIDWNPLLKEKKTCETANRYYNISTLIKNSSCQFFYFYPAFHEGDREQFNYIADSINVCGFAYKQKNHAANMLAGNMRYIICRDKEYMLQLYTVYKDKIINPIGFLFRTTSLAAACNVLWKEAEAFFKRKIKRQ